MTGLRRLPGLLRKSGSEPSLAPQPGLSRSGDLAAEVRQAGAEAWVRTDGNLAAISKGLDQSAYRIVRECLTNALKHARAHRAGVLLRCRGRCTGIDVPDDGTASEAPAPGGFGLLGMRVRVTVYGGTMRAGPRDAWPRRALG
jgi:signal transduction histidine kinase